MDKKSGLTTFGPEWLSFPKETKHASLEEDSNFSNGNPKSGRVYYSHSKKIPLKFTRSKSTPLLGNLEPRSQHQEKGDAFSMLRERNSFESDFPTLQPLNSENNETPPRPSSSAWHSTDSLTDVWKAPPSTSVAPDKPVNPPLHELAGLVPSLVPPKAKKDSKNRYNPSFFRKASSDPNLPIPPSYSDNYSRLMSKRQEKLIPKNNEKPKGTVLLNRDEFVRGLVKRDGTNSPVREDSPSRKEPDRKEDISHSRDPSEPPSQEEEITNGRNPKLVSVEDEERFLRDLGWVPEEEHHVPELTEEEILEVKNFMSNKISQHKPTNALDFQSTRKWQSEKCQSQPVK